MNKKAFASDNWSPVCPEIMEALVKCNQGHTPAYGEDPFSVQAKQIFKSHFGQKAEVLFVYNGTAANIISLASVCSSFNAIICSEHAHINVDECGAPEHFIGAKLIDLPTNNGKLSIAQLKPHINALRYPHQVVPRLVSISQPTELGTIYEVEEIKELAQFLHQNGLLLHIDGARLANAAVALHTDFKTMITDTGVDILSFGGTKNGMMFGEAIVVLNPELTPNIELLRKQGMQLASKMRYISVQFITLLSNNLWKTNAENANNTAHLLANLLSKHKQISFTQKVQSNGIWVKLPEEIANQLQKSSFFHSWNPQNDEYRIMTSFDTTENDILSFVGSLKF